MKQIKFYLLLVCIVALGVFAVSCNELPDVDINPEPTVHSVRFMSDGKTYESAITESGRVVSKPKKDPTKTSHRFLGWFADENGEELYDFSKPVTKSITLYAKFELDTEALKANIVEARNSIIKVQNKCYNNENDATIQTGVGFIFYKSDKYCYALTNCHTIKKQNGYSEQQVTVFDNDGNTYKGLSYRRSELDPIAIISQYDLAVVCFEYTGSKLNVMPREAKNPDKSDIVVSIGSNIEDVAYGEITDYKTYEWDMEEYLSNVDFEVLHHNAVLATGKESLLFNLDFSLVGITYTTEDGTAYAIPASRIHEFLYKYVYNS